MQDAPKPDGQVDLPANLVFLRRLVTALTAVMILGLLVVIALLVIRLQPLAPPLPEAIALPDGARATAFTATGSWYAVVTEDDRILIFDRDGGALIQTVTIEGD